MCTNITKRDATGYNVMKAYTIAYIPAIGTEYTFHQPHLDLPSLSFSSDYTGFLLFSHTCFILSSFRTFSVMCYSCLMENSVLSTS